MIQGIFLQEGPLEVLNSCLTSNCCWCGAGAAAAAGAGAGEGGKGAWIAHTASRFQKRPPKSFRELLQIALRELPAVVQVFLVLQLCGLESNPTAMLRIAEPGDILSRASSRHAGLGLVELSQLGITAENSHAHPHAHA